MNSSLKKDVGWSVLAIGAKTFTSVAIFLLLTRALGPQQFGLYAGSLALLLLIGPLVTFGTWHALVKRVSTNPSAAASDWGAALVPGVFAAGTAALVLAVLGDIAAPGLGFTAIFLLSLSEFLAIAVIEISIRTMQALGRFPAATGLVVSWSVIRLIAVAAALLYWPSSVKSVSAAFLLSTLVAAVVGSVALARTVGLPRFSWTESVAIAREGRPYSLTQASHMMLVDVDKQMLLRLDGQFATGIYASATRATGLVAMPLFAVLGATYPRFFARGERDGLRGTVAFASALALPVFAYALLMGIGLYFTAPLLDDILGSEFANSIAVLQAISLVPAFHLMGIVAGEALTGAGFAHIRNRFIVSAGIGNMALNLLLIGPFGINGAIVATYVSEAGLLFGLLIWINFELSKPTPFAGGSSRPGPVIDVRLRPPVPTHRQRRPVRPRAPARVPASSSR